MIAAMRLWALTVGATVLCAGMGHAQDSTASAPPSTGDIWLLSEVDERPVLDSVPVWYYPKGKVGKFAIVVFQAVIDPRGRVEPASIQLLSTSESSFNAAAALTLRAAYYRPARQEGIPVRVLVHQAINYKYARGRRCEITPLTPKLPPAC